MERLTFNVSSARVLRRLSVGSRVAAAAAAPFARRDRPSTALAATVRERYDWDYLWMIAFTALLFFRPQDQIPPLAVLHLAELTAIAGLAAMAVRRMTVRSDDRPHQPGGGRRARARARSSCCTMPFSIWPGGSLTVFSDIYVKIILIFALMMSTITTPKRLIADDLADHPDLRLPRSARGSSTTRAA